MDHAILVLQQVLFFYPVSVAIAWFLIHFIGEKSGVPHFLRAEVIFLPVIFSMAVGIFPGMIIGGLLSQLFGITGPISLSPILAGYVLSGAVLHFKLRSSVSYKLQSDLLIGAIFLLYAAGMALSIKGMST